MARFLKKRGNLAAPDVQAAQAIVVPLAVGEYLVILISAPGQLFRRVLIRAQPGNPVTVGAPAERSYLLFLARVSNRNWPLSNINRVYSIRLPRTRSIKDIRYAIAI